MTKIKKFIVVLMLTATLGPVSNTYAMDADASEQESKQDAAAIRVDMTQEERVEATRVAQFSREVAEQIQAIVSPGFLPTVLGNLVSEYARPKPTKEEIKAVNTDLVNALNPYNNLSLEKVIFALNAGADPNIVHRSKSPLHMIAKAKSADIEHVVHDASLCSIAKILIEKKANVNAGQQQKYLPLSTPLILAAHYEGSVEMIQLLLDAGADINAIDGWGETALCSAVMKQSKNTTNLNKAENTTKLVKILLDRNADPDLGGHHQCDLRPLVWLIPSSEQPCLKQIDLIKLLILAGAKPDNTSFNSPFNRANNLPKLIKDMQKAKKELDQLDALRDKIDPTLLPTPLFNIMSEYALLCYDEGDEILKQEIVKRKRIREKISTRCSNNEHANADG
jgi:ankyrin repeat protein